MQGHRPLVREGPEAVVAVVRAHAGVADAAEGDGGGDHADAEVVAVDVAGAGAVGHRLEPLVLLAVPVQDERAGPVVDVPDGLVDARVAEHGEDGTEHLVGVDVHLGRHPGEQRGRDLPGERVRQPLPRRRRVPLGRTLGHGVVHQPDDPLVVRGVDRGRVVRVADDRRQGAAPLAQDGVAERVVLVVVHEHVVRAHADLTAVDQAGRGDVTRCPLDVGGGVHDHRVLAAQLERHRGEVLGGVLGDGLTHAR